MKRNSITKRTWLSVLVYAPLLLCGVGLAAGCGESDSESTANGASASEDESSAGSGGGSSDGGAAPATGGSTASGTGGAQAAATSAGGTSAAAGGAPAAGGTPGAGGAPAASGGTPAAGGADTAAGGTPAAGGTTSGGAGGAGQAEEGCGFVTSQPVLTCPEQSDLASWLPSNPEDPCTKGCGPDKVGWKYCHQTENEEDCSVPPCAVCDLCQYDVPIHPCYQTPGDPALPLPPDCPEGTLKSDPCEPACDCTGTTTLCIHPKPSDTSKIEGCVCAERGKWACATYNTETNTWN